MSNLKYYQAIKRVHAKPMTRGEYNLYRSWVIPANENPDDAGYLVIYNMDTPQHYESWSPKSVFDEGYYELPTELDPQLQPMEQ